MKGMLKSVNGRFAQGLRAAMIVLGLLGVIGGASSAMAHCQVPCGIYDDSARIKSMLEDVTTIEKAVTELQATAKKRDAQSVNQKVRWVMNKEEHAQRIIDTISDYFLTQRVKPKQKDYATRVVNHHKVIVAAMKAKQSAKMAPVSDLREAVLTLAPYYPEPHKHK